MKDAIETLARRKTILQAIINADVGAGVEGGEKVVIEAKNRLSEVEAALNLITLNVPVSGRSELLLAFIKYWIGKSKRHDTHQTLEEIVEEFLKASNSR